jgi:hypothetical protein
MIASNAFICWNAEPSRFKRSVGENIFVGREVQGWILVYILVPPNSAIMGGSWEARKVIADNKFVVTYHIAC